MARSARAGTRRHVLKVLSDAKRTVSHLQGWWNVQGTVYEPNDGVRMGDWRERRADEYPENNTVYWASTHAKLDELIKELSELRDYAADQYFDLHRAERDGARS